MECAKTGSPLPVKGKERIRTCEARRNANRQCDAARDAARVDGGPDLIRTYATIREAPGRMGAAQSLLQTVPQLAPPLWGEIADAAHVALDRAAAIAAQGRTVRLAARAPDGMARASRSTAPTLSLTETMPDVYADVPSKAGNSRREHGIILIARALCLPTVGACEVTLTAARIRRRPLTAADVERGGRCASRGGGTRPVVREALNRHAMTPNVRDKRESHAAIDRRQYEMTNESFRERERRIARTAGPWAPMPNRLADTTPGVRRVTDDDTRYTFRKGDE